MRAHPHLFYLSLDYQNNGKHFVVHWPKPKACYRGKLLHVFSEDDGISAD